MSNYLGDVEKMPIIEVNTDELVSVDQASQETGVPRPTLYRWINQNKVNAFKIGGVIFIPKTEISKLRKKGDEQGLVDQ
jgi:excisionase family DNA binding protein